jgi:T5SS/PEP-CTERM-associated repeat protein
MRNFVRRCRRERAIGTNHRSRVRTLVSSTALVAVSTLFAPAMPAQAQTNWTGTTSTNWFTGSNWDNGVPTPGVVARLDTITPNPTVIVFGPTATTGPIFIGNTGTGQLTIREGGTLSSTLSVVGTLAGSQGTVTVTGGSSTWFNSSFFVGALGSGTLTIENGGRVFSTTSAIGNVTGPQGPGVGTVTVTGLGAEWHTSGGLTVGNQGIGMLTVSDGGLVTSSGGIIGNSGPQGTGQGTVTVTGATGAGSRWFIFGNLGIGNQDSTGTLTIADGGAVTNVEGRIGVVGPGS